MRALPNPHSSLWLIESLLPGMLVPESPVDPAVSWRGTWTVFSGLSATVSRTGSLDIECTRTRGEMVLDVAHQRQLMYRVVSATESVLHCRDDLFLTPRRWSTLSSTFDRDGDVVNQSRLDGWLDGAEFRLDGLAPSTQYLPTDAPHMTTWSLLAALPRLFAADRTGLSFHMIHELLVVSEDQRLELKGSINLQLASGVVPLQGWRLSGIGNPAIWFWLDARGWPVLVGGTQEALMLTSLEVIDPSEGVANHG